jgi:hypothetical protein
MGIYISAIAQTLSGKEDNMEIIQLKICIEIGKKQLQVVKNIH